MSEQDPEDGTARGLTRRQVLATTGTGGTVGLAGCLGGVGCQLTLDKSLDGQLHYGQQATYVFEVCSTDDTFFDTAGTCDQEITIIDDLPSGISFVSVSGSTGGGTWTSSVSGGTVELTNDTYGDIGDGTPSECLTVEMTVQVDTADQFSGPAPHDVENCADIEYDGQEYGTDCVPNTIRHDDCDLSFGKDVAGEFQYGQEATYVYEVCNEGDETCTGTMEVEDDLPDGISFVAASSGWTASASGGVVTATNDGYGGLDPGECLTLELLVQVAPMAEFPGRPTVQNCAVLSHEGEQVTEDCVTHDVTPVGECGLTLSKETGGEFVYGEEGTYVFEVCNEGDGPCASTIDIEDDLPSGLTFDSVSGTGWTASTSGGVVTLTNDTYGSLAPGDCLTVEVDVSINPPNEAPDAVTNCGDLYHDGDAVDQDCVDHPISHPDCEFEFEKDLLEEFHYGQQGTYVLEVCNAGDEECTGPLTIEDELPDGLSFVDVDAGWVASTSGGVVTLTNDGTGGIPAGQCLTVEMTVDVAPEDEFPGEDGAVQNCAVLSHDGDEVTESCLEHPVTADPCDLSVEKDTGTFGGFEFGGLGSYVYEVCNVGDTECDGPITVEDDLPDGISFGSVSAGWSASVSGGVVTATNDSYGSIAPGECVTLEMTVDVAPVDEFPGDGEEVQNCATFHYSGSVVDEDCVVHGVESPDPGDCPAVEHVLDTGYEQATGETLPPGADDGDWEIVTDTTGSGPVPRPATVVEDGDTVFGTQLPGTRWIAHQQDAQIDDTQETVAYEYCFCLHEDFTDPELSLSALADDLVADIQLNGTSLPFSGDGSVSVGSGVPVEETYTDPALFQAGENCLRVVVDDTQGIVSGLNVEGAVRAENADCDCVETCDLSVGKGTTGEFRYGEQFQAGYVYEVCNDGEETCSGKLEISDPLPDGISGPVDPGSGLTGQVNGGVFEGTIQYSGLAPGECLTRTVLVTVEDADAFPGDPPHEVENCADLLQDGTVVDDDCTTHDVTGGDDRPCPPVEFDLNTGYDQGSETTLGDGADDDDWAIVTDEAGTGPVPRPATVVNQSAIPGNWPTPFADSRWISHSADASYSPPPNSNYEYEYCFCLHEAFENPELTLQIRADNTVVDILLNDTSLGFDGDGGFLGEPIEETYTDPDRFQAGENCLTLVLENETGVAGLNVAGTMTAENADCECERCEPRLQKEVVEEFTYGEQGTYRFTVCNDGAEACTGAFEVEDDLPDGLSFASGTFGGDWSATVSGGVVTATNDSYGSLAPGDCIEFEMTVDVASEAEFPGDADTVENCATLFQDGDAVDESCVGHDIAPGESCALQIQKEVAEEFTYGEQGSYLVTVCNSGERKCTETLVVQDDLPDGLSFVSASGDWTGTVSSGEVTVTNDSYGGLAPGDCIDFEMVVDVAPVDEFPGGSDDVENCAMLVQDGMVSALDCVTHPVTPGEEPTCEFTFEKTAVGEFVYGEQATYEFELCSDPDLNDGECTGPLTIEDDLPDGISFVSVSGNWNASVSGGVVTATNDSYGGLDPGDCLTMTMTVQVGSQDEVPGDEVQNCGQLQHNGQQVADDCVTHPVKPGQEPACEFSFEKNTRDEFVYGKQATYEFELCSDPDLNDGECTGPLTIEDDLPDGISFVSVSGNWTASVSGGVVTATNDSYGGLDPGDCLIMTMTVQVGGEDEVPDEVQNCGQLQHSGQQVADDCVTHQIY